MSVNPRGDISSPIWVILYTPSEADLGAGSIMSGTEGWHFNKLFDELGLPQPYITCVEKNNVIQQTTTTDFFAGFLQYLDGSLCRPPIILLVGAKTAETFCPETRNYKKPHDCKLDKWAGSLLISPYIKWSHYCIPLWEPSYFFADYSYRDIYKFIDLGKAKDVLDVYTSTNGSLLPLPNYRLLTNPSYTQLLDYLNDCRTVEWCSVDIETIRPPVSRDPSRTRTGHMYTIAIAPSNQDAVSFQLWRWEAKQRVRIWESLNYLLKHTKIIGQNFSSFDAHYMEAYGLEPDLSRFQDTRIRHHILWPELPHSLQFQTKQYTRQKYYKDEGKTWSPKQLDQLLHYNALDAVVTYEVFLKQEEEFNERPQLI